MQADKPPKSLADIRSLARQAACPVHRSRIYLKEFLADVMCGRCFPCGFGAYEMLTNLDAIFTGKGTRENISAIRRIADNMTIGSLCKRGKEVGEYILECLRTEGFSEHTQGRCRTLTCPSFFHYTILGGKCIGCGECLKACAAHAIIGKKRTNAWETGDIPFEIRQRRCSKSGACRDACPTGAIVLVGHGDGGVAAGHGDHRHVS